MDAHGCEVTTVAAHTLLSILSLCYYRLSLQVVYGYIEVKLEEVVTDFVRDIYSITTFLGCIAVYNTVTVASSNGGSELLIKAVGRVTGKKDFQVVRKDSIVYTTATRFSSVGCHRTTTHPAILA